MPFYNSFSSDMNYTVCIITCFAGKRNNNLKNLYFYLQKDFSSVKITNVANLYIFWQELTVGCRISISCGDYRDM